MSNSNFNITKVIVDPTSQEITNLEINGKAFESGSEVNLETRFYSIDNKLNVQDLFPTGPVKPGPVLIQPSSGYDGFEMITIEPEGLTGYPGEGLEFRNNPDTYSSGISSTITIDIPKDEVWAGTITIHPLEP